MNGTMDWMNLIWFILSKPENRYEKIDKFIKLAINSPARVKYRDVMSKKSDQFEVFHVLFANEDFFIKKSLKFILK